MHSIDLFCESYPSIDITSGNTVREIPSSNNIIFHLFSCLKPCVQTFTVLRNFEKESVVSPDFSGKLFFSLAKCFDATPCAKFYIF